MEQIEMRLKNKDLEIEFRMGEGKDEKQIELITDILKHFSLGVDHELEAFKNMLENGYQFNKSQTGNLHDPGSEYDQPADQEESSEESQDELTKRLSVRERNGKRTYQTFYICTQCGDKRKLFIEKGTVYAYCHECGNRMRVRDAVAGSNGKEQDTFGNFYIAGKFKRADEMEERKRACNE